MNSINNYDALSFQSRELVILTQQISPLGKSKNISTLPLQIRNAIMENQALDTFIKEGNPKGFWQKLRKLPDSVNEILEITYTQEREKESNLLNGRLHFKFYDDNSEARPIETYICTSLKNKGSSHKEMLEESEMQYYLINAIVDKINKIEDFHKFLGI